MNWVLALIVGILVGSIVGSFSVSMVVTRKHADLEAESGNGDHPPKDPVAKGPG